jgi:photosystem II stability/assembly factor-like uncharacterized protein
LTLALQGQTLQLTAQAAYADLTIEDVTMQSTWTSSDTSVAVVSTSGLVTAVSSGSVEISARYQTHTATKLIEVDIGNDLDWVFLGAIYASGVTDTGVSDIVVDRRDADLLYVAGNRGLFVSRNRGASWRQHHATPDDYNNPMTHSGVLAEDATNPDRVFYAVDQTLRVSRDKGTTWNVVTEFADFIRSVEVSRLDSRTIYVGVQGPSNLGVLRSIDDGLTWETHPFPYPTRGATEIIPWDIAEDPVDGTLYVPTELTPHLLPYRPPRFRSLDRGLSWQDITGSFELWHGIKIVVHPLTREVLLLTEGGGLYSSTDRGVTWRKLGNTFFSLELLMDPNRMSRVFGGEVVFGLHPGGVFLSTDGARTFMPYGLDGRTCGSLALSGDSTLLYAACYNSGIFVRRLP